MNFLHLLTIAGFAFVGACSSGSTNPTIGKGGASGAPNAGGMGGGLAGASTGSGAGTSGMSTGSGAGTSGMSTGGGAGASGASGNAGASAVGGAAGSTPGDGGQPGTFTGLDPSAVLAGFRASSYGPREWAELHGTTFEPDSAYWVKVARSMAGRFDKGTPAGIYIVGELATDNGCNLKFPASGQEPARIHFAVQDTVEPALAAFDKSAVKVWLQVESGDADVPALIDIVLSRYRQHPSVIGFGIDVEWYEESTNPGEGKAVTDALAAAWLERVRKHNPHYTLMLKHWLTAKMPATVREGLFFVNDGQGVSSMAVLVDHFKTWGGHFSPSPVGYQIGYENDKRWWSTLSDPPGTLGGEVLKAVPNARALFWVDFTVHDVIAPD
jgi:hypothetical protein